MPNRVDLDDYRDPPVLVMAGRERGKKARLAAGLDRLDQNTTPTEVHVPAELFSVNASFFLGMFGPSISRLGEEKFRRRYAFVGKDISRTIDDCIREALRVASPL